MLLNFLYLYVLQLNSPGTEITIFLFYVDFIRGYHNGPPNIYDWSCPLKNKIIQNHTYLQRRNHIYTFKHPHTKLPVNKNRI